MWVLCCGDYSLAGAARSDTISRTPHIGGIFRSDWGSLVIRWYLTCLGFLILFGAGCGGGGESAPAPVERESVVSEKPATPPPNTPKGSVEEGRLPDRFKR